MFGASLLKLVKFGFSFSLLEFFILAFGMIVAFVVSIFVIRFLMSYIKKHDFKVFGWYRIALGIIVLVFLYGSCHFLRCLSRQTSFILGFDTIDFMPVFVYNIFGFT